MTPDPAVFVAGSLHLDVVVRAPHLPAPDETVMGSSVAYVCGGKGGNQALAASLHGARVCMAGCIGPDANGQVLLENLRVAGVASEQIQRHATAPSGMSVAIVESGGDYGAVVVSGSNQHIETDAIKLATGTRVVVLQNEIPEAVNIAVAHLARAEGAKVVLNAAPMREMSDALLDAVDVLIVNRIEAGAYLSCNVSDASSALVAVGNRKSGPHDLVVTLGGSGLVHHSLGAEPVHTPAFPVSVASTHGAGDAFAGALAARLAHGDAMDVALRYAAAAGALLVAHGREHAEDTGPEAVRALIERNT